jgi:hypothetical protein
MIVVPADAVANGLSAGSVAPGLAAVIFLVTFVGLALRWARWAGRSV